MPLSFHPDFAFLPTHLHFSALNLHSSLSHSCPFRRRPGDSWGPLRWTRKWRSSCLGSAGAAPAGACAAQRPCYPASSDTYGERLTMQMVLPRCAPHFIFHVPQPHARPVCRHRLDLARCRLPRIPSHRRRHRHEGEFESTMRPSGILFCFVSCLSTQAFLL